LSIRFPRRRISGSLWPYNVKYRKLGNTDISVSAVCMGGWSIVTEDFTWGGNDLQESIAAIRASLEAGVNFFDSAEGYGNGESEEILAQALGNRRRDVIIATKVAPAHLRAGEVKRCCEQSLRRLRSDYIDLYQIHWPNPEIPLAETLEAMEQFKQAGKIRAIGVSNFGVSFLREALAIRRVESNQLAYSLLWRVIEDEVRPVCAANDISILCYSPLSQGLLTGKFSSADEVPPTRARIRLFSRSRPHARHGQGGCEAQVFQAIADIRTISQSLGMAMGQVALAWLLAQKAVTSVVAGARNAAQAAANAQSADIELPPEVLSRLSEATDGVKQLLGGNADMWQSVSRMERRG